MSDAAARPNPLSLLARGSPFGADGDWLAVMALCTVAETGWWAIAWGKGIAPAPVVPVYVGAAAAALVIASGGQRLLNPAARRPALIVLVTALALVGLGASLFLPLKYSIPEQVPFWLDRPLALAERSLLGGDPWRLLDRAAGWATLPLDRLYGLWLPVQLLALFAVIVQPPSAAKSRALIAYALAWFVLGVVAATVLSSAGPIFYDRLIGGSDFGALRTTLRLRGATMALAESDAMWTSFANGRPSLVAGMSAVPSLHVAISLWMALAARALAPRLLPAAIIYFVLIFVGSVQLGWHYVADGVVAALGMAAIWRLSALGQRRPVGF